MPMRTDSISPSSRGTAFPAILQAQDEGEREPISPGFGLLLECGGLCKLTPLLQLLLYVLQLGFDGGNTDVTQLQAKWRSLNFCDFYHGGRGLGRISRLRVVRVVRPLTRCARGRTVVGNNSFCASQGGIVKEISSEWSWFHDGDLDSKRFEFRLQGFAETLHHEFGGAVYSPSRPRSESPDGAKVQDVTRLAGAHGRQGGTRNIECSFDVYCECRANLISGDFFDGPNEPAARVVDQHIDLAKTLQRGTDCFLRLLFIGHVELQSQ